MDAKTRRDIVETLYIRDETLMWRRRPRSAFTSSEQWAGWNRSHADRPVARDGEHPSTIRVGKARVGISEVFDVLAADAARRGGARTRKAKTQAGLIVRNRGFLQRQHFNPMVYDEAEMFMLVRQWFETTTTPKGRAIYVRRMAEGSLPPIDPEITRYRKSAAMKARAAGFPVVRRKPTAARTYRMRHLKALRDETAAVCHANGVQLVWPRNRNREMLVPEVDEDGAIDVGGVFRISADLVMDAFAAEVGVAPAFLARSAAVIDGPEQRSVWDEPAAAEYVKRGMRPPASTARLTEKDADVFRRVLEMHGDVVRYRVLGAGDWLGLYMERHLPLDDTVTPMQDFLDRWNAEKAGAEFIRPDAREPAWVMKSRAVWWIEVKDILTRPPR